MKNLISIILLSLYLMMTKQIYASSIYKCQMLDGSTQFSNTPCKKISTDKIKLKEFTGKKIDSNYENLDIKEIISKVAKSANYIAKFDNIIKNTISVNFKNKTAEETIYRIAYTYNLSVVFNGELVYISKNNIKIETAKKNKCPYKYIKCSSELNNSISNHDKPKDDKPKENLILNYDTISRMITESNHKKKKSNSMDYGLPPIGGSSSFRDSIFSSGDKGAINELLRIDAEIRAERRNGY